MHDGLAISKMICRVDHDQKFMLAAKLLKLCGGKCREGRRELEALAEARHHLDRRRLVFVHTPSRTFPSIEHLLCGHGELLSLISSFAGVLFFAVLALSPLTRARSLLSFGSVCKHAQTGITCLRFHLRHTKKCLAEENMGRLWRRGCSQKLTLKNLLLMAMTKKKTAAITARGPRRR